MIKAILMDFNGVIINDEPVQMRAYQEILKSKELLLGLKFFPGSNLKIRLSLLSNKNLIK